MLDEDKFEGFKQNLINENEDKYGEEIRKQYGNKVVNQSNTKIKNMTADDFKTITNLEMEIKTTLQKAFASGNPAGPLAQKAADLHKQWLSYYWNSYSKEAHANLTQMYISDERFKAYYDQEQPGTAQFLREAVLIYTGMKP